MLGLNALHLKRAVESLFDGCGVESELTGSTIEVDVSIVPGTMFYINCWIYGNWGVSMSTFLRDGCSVRESKSPPGFFLDMNARFSQGMLPYLTAPRSNYRSSSPEL